MSNGKLKINTRRIKREIILHSFNFELVCQFLAMKKKKENDNNNIKRKLYKAI